MKYSALIILLIGLAVLLASGLSRRVNRRAVDPDVNPFEYNLDAFKTVDPQLVRYREAPPIATELTTLYGVAIGSDDRIHVTGDRSLLVLDRAGAVITRTALSAPATCLAVGPDSSIYLGLVDHVEVHAPDGARAAVWPVIASNSVITCLAVTTGAVYVADAGARRVWHFDHEGRLLGSLGDKDEEKGVSGFIIPRPYFDLLPDDDGSLWVVNPGRRRVENYGPDGYFRRSWGESGARIEGFSGCCNPTHIARLPNGAWITSEKGLVRVKQYDSNGRFVGVVATPDQFAKDAVGLDLAITSDGRILVLDTQAGVVRVFVAK